jgi:hypothetical protein
MEQVMMVDEQCEDGVAVATEQQLDAEVERVCGFRAGGPDMGYFLAQNPNNDATQAFVPDGAEVLELTYYPSRREYRLHWRKNVLQGSRPRMVGLGLREPTGVMM